MNIQFSWPKIALSWQTPSEEPVVPARINKRLWGIVIAILILLSIGSWWFYYAQGLTLAYNDARSHLNVARRVVDSLQPGIAQIGSVWLPLYHVLELPFVWNDYLWHTGIAGSIISMAAYILGGIYMVKIGMRLRLNLPATLLVLATYAINPNLLFLQTAPMTESLLLTLTIITGFYTLAWVQTSSLIHILMAGLFAFLATLTRYDGWFLLAYVTAVIAWITYKKHGYKTAEGNVVLFVTLAGFGVFLWLMWNLLIFGDPLYFALGEFSAKAQQDILLSEGRLITKGSIIYSVFVYLFTVRYNLGTWLTVIACLGLWVLKISKNYTWREKMAISVLLSPLLFNIISLLAGHSVIHLPELPPYTWFNDRYGLMMLPAAAVAVGILANTRKLVFILATLILLMQTQLMYLGNNIITIEDGVRGASGEYLDTAGNWVRDNIREGLILVAASSNDSLLFRTGLPLKQFIVEGARKHWDESMVDPTIHAAWIIMHKGDLVEKNMRSNPMFLANYRLVYHDDFSYIYKREMGSDQPVTDTQLPQ